MLTRRLLLPTPALLIRPARAATLPFGALRGATTAAGVYLTRHDMALVGSRVTMPGFMATPLYPKIGFCSHAYAHVNVHVLQQRLRLAGRNCVRAPYPRPVPVEPRCAIAASGTFGWGAAVDQEPAFSASSA